MKTHTSNLKNNIKKIGRVLDSKITYTLDNEEIVLGMTDLNSVTPSYTTSLLKSVMKQLDIDSNVEIPEGTVINYRLGVLVNGSFEYLNYGNYVVYSVEKQEDVRSYKITCYDKMLYAMKDYEAMNITYPITIRNYIGAIATHLGLAFANASDTFTNYNREIAAELYLDSEGNSLGYTFRDVLDELAQATASNICINEETDELEVRYITNTNDIINEEFFKDINVTFKEKYGPVNSIVLSRASGADNVYLQDETSIEENGLCEIKITDNQIMNWNDRSDYLPGILARLNGLEYYLNDFSSTGIFYYNVCDRYNASVDGNSYSCVMFNDEVNITQGAEENIYTDMPEETQTDYTKSDKTDRKINQTYLIVDKQNQTIQSVVNTVTEQNSKISQVTQTVDELNSKISDIADITISGESSYATFDLDNINQSEPIMIKIRPTVENISYLYPRSNLYPSSNQYLKTRTLRFYNKTTSEKIDYILPDDLLFYNNQVYDEFYLNYDSQTCQVTKRCGYNADGSVYALATEQVVSYPYPQIVLTDGDYTISLQGYQNGYLFARLMAQNIYTTQFATKAELNSAITQTAAEINLEVSKKVDENEVVSVINQSAEKIYIQSNRIEIQSDNFTLTDDGEITATAGDIAGFEIDSEKGFVKKIYAPYDYTQNDINRVYSIIMGQVTPTQSDYEKYDFDNSGTITASDYVNILWYVKTGITTTNYGKFVITAPPSSKRLFDAKMGFYDAYGNLVNGFGHNGGDFNSLSIKSSGETNTIAISPNYIRLEANNDEKITLDTSSGNIRYVSLTQISKEDVKKNFEKLTNAKEILEATDIYKYNLKDEKDNDKKHVGLVIGDKFNYSKEITSKDNSGVDLYSMVSVLWQVVKEQEEEINKLKEMIKNA